MKRGELYRVSNPSSRDPKRYRVFVVVSRQALIGSSYSSVVCAPVYTAYHGLVTQVQVGPNEGLKHHSSIHCDDLVSLPKTVLTYYVGSLPPSKMRELNIALGKALDLPNVNYL
ncbi:MAG: type II toxin-antitoxin system PemK/MazF family toxin [Candidatus Hydrogenedentes bacterium]|nr:type II toxin-antitoxin system PemK/MazF family toxin [Candidatus Hydrogenedentota bacterium]